jgi:hypothetical protein
MTRYASLLATVVFGACVPHAETSKLPPVQPQCDFVNYHHDESVNVQGPSRCTTDCDCDGLRSCTDGVCQGEARPTGLEDCRKPGYLWNEAWNGGGPGLCANDCECNGTRTCVGGHCQDSPAHAGDSAFTK